MKPESIPPAEAVLNGTIGILPEKLDSQAAHVLTRVLEYALQKRLEDAGTDYAREGAEFALGFLKANGPHDVAVSLAWSLANRSFPLDYDSPAVAALVARHGDVVFPKNTERPSDEILH